MKPSCPQLAGTERIRPHPEKSYREQLRMRTLLTLRDVRRNEERKRQHDWSRSRVS